MPNFSATPCRTNVLASLFIYSVLILQASAFLKIAHCTSTGFLQGWSVFSVWTFVGGAFLVNLALLQLFGNYCEFDPYLAEFLAKHTLFFGSV